MKIGPWTLEYTGVGKVRMPKDVKLLRQRCKDHSLSKMLEYSDDEINREIFRTQS